MGVTTSRPLVMTNGSRSFTLGLPFLLVMQEPRQMTKLTASLNLRLGWRSKSASMSSKERFWHQLWNWSMNMDGLHRPWLWHVARSVPWPRYLKLSPWQYHARPFIVFCVLKVFVFSLIPPWSFHPACKRPPVYRECDHTGMLDPRCTYCVSVDLPPCYPQAAFLILTHIWLRLTDSAPVFCMHVAGRDTGRDGNWRMCT